MDTIRIGEKFYDATKLTEHATALINDINQVEGELKRLQLQTSIATLAKSTIVEKLVKETVNLTEVDAPKED